MTSLADQAIKRQVEQAIAFDPRVSAFDIKVQVLNGVARLEGVVQNLAAKHAATKAAASVAGIRRVDSMIAVEDPRGLGDAQIELVAEEALTRDPAIDPKEVGVEVEDSTAYLVGHVDDVADEAAAVDAVSHAEGIKEVISEIDISPGRDIDWTDLKNQVTDALDDSPEILPYAIEVEIGTDGKLVLSGRVRNELARKQAEEIARRVPGVKDVDNRLVIG